MTDHQKQTTFFKALLTCDDTPEHRRLQEQIAVAERDVRCIGRACRLVVLAGLFAVAGLGYCAVLLPQFFESSRHHLVQLFCALGLGSMLCLTVFMSVWYRYRRAVSRLHDDCRRLITSRAQSRFQPAPSTVLVQESELAVYQTGTQSATASSETDIIELRKVS